VNTDPFDKLKEECGVVGIFGHPEAGRLASLALHALQHRGQEGAGIATCDGEVIRTHRGQGLVGEVFGTEESLAALRGESAIGHVRYSTAGGNSLRNVQPFTVSTRRGQVSIAHNGNLVNARRIRDELEDRGSIFGTSSDTEVFLHLIAASHQPTFINRVVDALNRVQGAYSLALLTNEYMVAVRDPHGFRPLVLGELDGATIVASETCALDLLGGKYIREVEPGEMIIVDERGVSSLSPFPRRPRKACIFEHIYFARPNSVVYGESVYQTRHRHGQLLSQVLPVVADQVIAVPDSGTPAALGYAQASGIPFQQGLIRSHYVGRTFIEPSQKIRDFGVKLKLSPVASVIGGRRIVVVDDSLVRGTTSKKIVRLLREAGATEVHLRIASPPIKGSCFYGIDTPTQTELIAHEHELEAICDFVGADSLAYLPLDFLRRDLGTRAEGFCDACFSLDYPVDPEVDDPVNQLPLFDPDDPEG